MARPLRIEYENALYHITTRGNAGNDIFKEDADFYGFLKVLKSVIGRYDWICYAYCLMDNHYHLLVETPNANLSIGMRQLNGVFTQNFNKRHKSYGHLFQGRFKAIIVDKQSYLLELSRYIVLNPVRAKMVTDPKDYKWSSYHEIIGGRKKPAIVDSVNVLAHFGENFNKAKERYAKFVYDGISEEPPWRFLKDQLILGDDDFRNVVKDKFTQKIEDLEIPRMQRLVTTKKLDQYFAGKNPLSKKQREQMIYRAFKDGYQLNEIGAFLGVHYATVSRVVKKVEDEMWQNKT